VIKQQDGCRSRYPIPAHLPPPEAASQEPAIGEVSAVLAAARDSHRAGSSHPAPLLNPGHLRPHGRRDGQHAASPATTCAARDAPSQRVGDPGRGMRSDMRPFHCRVTGGVLEAVTVTVAAVAQHAGCPVA
jgi:hypothetical protein